jgi:hypothetical protein
MKKMMMIPVLLLSLVITVHGAGDPVVSAAAKAGFEREFTGATQVEWSVQGDLYKASFQLAGTHLDAYFSNEGELKGSIRALLFNQLPLPVITSLEKKFGGESVLDVFEINNANGTHYRLTVVKKDKKYRVKCDGLGHLLETERLRVG